MTSQPLPGCGASRVRHGFDGISNLKRSMHRTWRQVAEVLSWAALALSVFLAGVYASAMVKERAQRSETIGPLTESWAELLRRRHQQRMLRKLGAERKEVAKIQ